MHLKITVTNRLAFLRKWLAEQNVREALLDRDMHTDQREAVRFASEMDIVESLLVVDAPFLVLKWVLYKGDTDEFTYVPCDSLDAVREHLEEHLLAETREDYSHKALAVNL